MRIYALLATLAKTAVRKVALTRFDQGRETERFEVGIREPHRERYVTPFQVRSATVQHRRNGGVNGSGKGRGQGL